MPLPMVRRCCGCLSLEVGVYILCLLSTVACLSNIAAGAWNLPTHKQREPEDNLISMSMVMFSSLSTVSNLVAGTGTYLRRPNYLQLSLLFNMIFIACIFLIAVVTCLFSPELRKIHFFESPGNITLVVLMMLAGASKTELQRQLSLLSNMIFIACIFLITVVTCLFSPELRKVNFFKSPGTIALVVIIMLAGSIYSLYYLSVVNALYRTMKDDCESAIPI